MEQSKMSGGALQFTRESGAEPAARRGAGVVLDLIRSDRYGLYYVPAVQGATEEDLRRFSRNG